MWRGGAKIRWCSGAEITVRWCGGAKIKKVAHITVARTKKSGSRPALQPSIPQQWYWHGTVWQGSVRFNLRVKTRQLLAFPILLYIIYLWSHASHNLKQVITVKQKLLQCWALAPLLAPLRHWRELKKRWRTSQWR